MGASSSSSSKERFERAATTGTLTVDSPTLRSWRKLVKGLATLPKLRTMTVSGTRLIDPVPHTFFTLPLWNSLVFLDLSHNGLTCACALGAAGPLSKSHAEELQRQIEAPAGALSPSPAPSAVSAMPLESLNLSGNALHLLPPSLSSRFPRLRRLVCADNAVPLIIPVSLSRCIGASTSLEVVDLRSNQLKRLVLAEEASAPPLPALREVLLDGNHLGGTLSLGMGGEAAVDEPLFPALRRLSVESQKGQQPLQAVDPAIFAHCPGLTSLSLCGNPNEDSIRAALGKSVVYRRWQEQQAEVINKKIGAGGSAELMQ